MKFFHDRPDYSPEATAIYTLALPFRLPAPDRGLVPTIAHPKLFGPEAAISSAHTEREARFVR